MSWRVAINEQRIELPGFLAENPSLAAEIESLLVALYPKAVKKAAWETGLKADKFPAACPWTIEQMMDEEFWP